MLTRLALPLLFSAMAISAHAAAGSGDQVQQVLYQCERDIQLPITYINTAGGGAYAVMQMDGQQIPMSIAVSASGARYVSIDEQRSYSWHTKNNEGVVSWKPADEMDKPMPLLIECTTSEL